MGAATSQAVVAAVAAAIALAAAPVRAETPAPIDPASGSAAPVRAETPAPIDPASGSAAPSDAASGSAAPVRAETPTPVDPASGSAAPVSTRAPVDATAGAKPARPSEANADAKPDDAHIDAKADVRPPRGSCTGITARGARFAACFDPGNRLSLTAAADGAHGGAIDIGFGIALRHEITFDDDPDLEWKMSHRLLDGTHDTTSSSFDAIVYSGLYLRHSRDGHIVLPFGVPKKVYLPFDIGALAEVGRFDWRAGDPTATVGIVRVAPLIDFARTQSERAVLAIGPSAHWDVAWNPEMHAVAEHRVAPFTEGLVDLRLESHDGLTIGDARVEAGTAWHSVTGWRPELRAQASLERTLIAVDDRPVAVTLGVQYDTVTGEAVAAIGARFILATKTDPRVNLTPLASR